MKKYWTSTLPLLLKIVGITLIGMIMTGFWNAGNWFVLGVQIVIYVAIYGIAVYYIAFNTYEKELVQGMANKFIRKR